jgi:nicotinate-nucleotide adenylyltransferase
LSKYRILPINSGKISIGLLGGSFNPAHEGHVYISNQALSRCGLNKVMWLVTPQNPIKSLNTRNSLQKRADLARNASQNPNILISVIEKYFNNTYTANSLKRIKLMHPNVNFVWIMGADNVTKFNKWYKWKWIADNFDILIFDREDNHKFIHASKLNAYTKHMKVLKYKKHFDTLNKNTAFIKLRKVNISSTEIRNKNEHNR